MKISLKDILKIVHLPVIFASLCCLSPIIIVLLSLGTVATASSLADLFYGQYVWVFRLIGLIFLVVSLVLYLKREKGICTLDQVKKERNKIINIVFVSLAVGVLGYIVWLYVVLHYIGKFLQIWD